MSDTAKLETLHRRLVEEQKLQLEAAASVNTLPPNDMLHYISDLESVIVAIEMLIEEGGR